MTGEYLLFDKYTLSYDVCQGGRKKNNLMHQAYIEWFHYRRIYFPPHVSVKQDRDFIEYLGRPLSFNLADECCLWKQSIAVAAPRPRDAHTAV